MGEYEKIFKFAINIETEDDGARTKFASICRRISDGNLYLHLRTFYFCGKAKKFFATIEGVSLSSLQAGNLLTMLKEGEFSYQDYGIEPKGKIMALDVFNGLESSWISVTPGGKQLVISKRKGEGISGFQLSAEEFHYLMNVLPCLDLILRPKPVTKKDLAFFAVAAEIRRNVVALAHTHCSGCYVEHPSQRRHSCLVPNIEDHFEEAKNQVDKAVVKRILHHYSVVTRQEPPPTDDQVRAVLIEEDTLLNYLLSDKQDDFETLLCHMERK